ncbi:MAG: T9SS type A sorting domain-containing protein [Saprospiraceae bacterium]|nr:T9SS type A sorting domain-containing protein [Saprospiraceae bacterium]
MNKLTLIKSVIKYFVILLFISSGLTSYSQCNIQATVSQNTICAGDSILLSATGGCGYLMKNDFNNGTVGLGWYSTLANPIFTNPCDSGLNGHYIWIGATTTYYRVMETTNYNVSIGNCVINWDMRYGREQNIGNCNASDAIDEGVHLQYTVNNGCSWTDFPSPNILPTGSNNTTPPFITTIPGSGGYWQPVSDSISQSNNAAYYWHKYSCVIPPVASITNAKFRWAQLCLSNTEYDTWGIDNVEIICPTGNVNVLWSTGDTVFNPTAIYLPPHPNNHSYDTCFIITISDSIYSATDTICIHVSSPTINLGQDTTIGFSQTITLDAGAGFISYLWQDSTTNQYRQIIGSVAGIGIHTYYVTVANVYGCIASDTIIIEVIDDTGINYKTNNSSISIIPNPANARLNIEFNNYLNLSLSENLEILIFNSLGKLVKTKDLKASPKSLDISDLPQGLYIIAIKRENEIIARERFVISR